MLKEILALLFFISVIGAFIVGGMSGVITLFVLLALALAPARL